jgi:hypothetical protein
MWVRVGLCGVVAGRDFWKGFDFEYLNSLLLRIQMWFYMC